MYIYTNLDRYTVIFFFKNLNYFVKVYGDKNGGESCSIMHIAFGGSTTPQTLALLCSPPLRAKFMYETLIGVKLLQNIDKL